MISVGMQSGDIIHITEQNITKTHDDDDDYDDNVSTQLCPTRLDK